MSIPVIIQIKVPAHTSTCYTVLTGIWVLIQLADAISPGIRGKDQIYITLMFSQNKTIHLYAKKFRSGDIFLKASTRNVTDLVFAHHVMSNSINHNNIE